MSALTYITAEIDALRALGAAVRVVDVPVGALGYGVDLAFLDDITPDAAELAPDSAEGIGQDLYHRLSTRRGGLPPGDDKDYGFDLVGALHKGHTAKELTLLAAQIKAECLKDDRVAELTVTVTPSGGGRTLGVRLIVTPEDPAVGVFSLVLAVSDGGVLLDAIGRGVS